MQDGNRLRRPATEPTHPGDHFPGAKEIHPSKVVTSTADRDITSNSMREWYSVRGEQKPNPDSVYSDSRLHYSFSCAALDTQERIQSQFPDESAIR